MSGYSRAEMVNHKDRLYELGRNAPGQAFQVGREEGRRGARPAGTTEGTRNGPDRLHLPLDPDARLRPRRGPEQERRERGDVPAALPRGRSPGSSSSSTPTSSRSSWCSSTRARSSRSSSSSSCSSTCRAASPGGSGPCRRSRASSRPRCSLTGLGLIAVRGRLGGRAPGSATRSARRSSSTPTSSSPPTSFRSQVMGFLLLVAMLGVIVISRRRSAEGFRMTPSLDAYVLLSAALFAIGLPRRPGPAQHARHLHVPRAHARGRDPGARRVLALQRRRRTATCSCSSS